MISQSFTACHQLEKFPQDNPPSVITRISRLAHAEVNRSTDFFGELYMKKTLSTLISAKRVAVAVATVFATLSAPAFAAEDNKAVMDLMLKKGLISQQEYDQHMKLAEDAAENKAFKEKRLDDDMAKANKYMLKNAEAGSVMKNGLGIQSADGAYSAQLTGRVSMDYRSFSQSGGTDANQAKFDYRRARFGLRGNMSKDFEYMLFANFTDSAATADEAYLTYVGFKPAQFRVGKFKMPFSLEQLTSSNNIDFMERSLVGSVEGEFIPAKQQGAMLFGSPVSGLSYAAALSVGTNKSATVDKPEFIGRVSANLAELAGNSSVVTHVGLGYSIGEITSISSALTATNEGRGATKPFTSVVVGAADRTRTGLELAIAYDAYKLQAERFDFKYDQVTGATLKADGYYVQALWNITGEKHNYSNSSGTFGWIKPTTAFSTSKGGLGAWQLGYRYSKIDGSDGLGATGKAVADSNTIGLNWIANSNVRVMLNFVTTNHAVAISSISQERAVNLRAQVSF